jgi:hypothetical protein
VFNPFSFGSDKAKISAYYDPVEYARAYSTRKDKQTGVKTEPSAAL